MAVITLHKLGMCVAEQSGVRVTGLGSNGPMAAGKFQASFLSLLGSPGEPSHPTEPDAIAAQAARAGRSASEAGVLPRGRFAPSARGTMFSTWPGSAAAYHRKAMNAYRPNQARG